MAKKVKVLIVDDEMPVLNVVARMVERLGYTAVTAMHGTDALRIVKEQNIELLLLDVVLRDMTIVELVHRTQALHGQRKIILMSGHFQNLEINLSGTLPFLQKPFTIQELKAALDKLQSHEPAGLA
jgi:DNA-binding NtrC family response regulator